MNTFKYNNLSFFLNLQKRTFCTNFHEISDLKRVTSQTDYSKNFVPREHFRLPTQFDKRTWYPKHMGVQLKRMEGKLRTVDLLVEVALFLINFRLEVL